MNNSYNKGEWSELYVLLALLSSGKLYSANNEMEKLGNVFFPILKILREEKCNQHLEYNLHEQDIVELYINGNKVKSLPRKLLKEYAAQILHGIVNATEKQAFPINNSDHIMKDLAIDSVKARSSDKTDIQLMLHDIHTGYEGLCGFSIKSELGSAPTLLNASSATNFVYDICDIDDAIAKDVNSIESRNKIIDRIKKINEFGYLVFVGAENETFHNNLFFIDSNMETILGESLKYYYQYGIGKCEEIVEELEKNNPCFAPISGFYRYKFKKFLCAVALGMMPSKPWSGYDEANGGYIVVTTNGDIVAYHIYNRDIFENYLLSHTKFERGSTSKHGFASVYKENGNYRIKLNLQIRFTDN